MEYAHKKKAAATQSLNNLKNARANKNRVVENDDQDSENHEDIPREEEGGTAPKIISVENELKKGRRKKPFRFKDHMLQDPNKGVLCLYSNFDENKFFKDDPPDEFKLLHKYMRYIQEWHFYFMPKYDFDFFLDRCKEYGSKPTVKALMSRFRKAHKGDLPWKDFRESLNSETLNEEENKNQADQGTAAEGKKDTQKSNKPNAFGNFKKNPAFNNNLNGNKKFTPSPSNNNFANNRNLSSTPGLSNQKPGTIKPQTLPQYAEDNMDMMEIMNEGEDFEEYIPEDLANEQMNEIANEKFKNIFKMDEEEFEQEFMDVEIDSKKKKVDND